MEECKMFCGFTHQMKPHCANNFQLVNWQLWIDILNKYEILCEANHLRNKVSSDVWLHKTFYTLPKLEEIVLEERNKLLENHTSDETLLQISFLLIHMDEAAESAV